MNRAETIGHLALRQMTARPHVGEMAPDLLTATVLAQQSIESGEAAAKLDALIRGAKRKR
jgi:anthranilate phosphoribosyltransferase